MSAVTEGRFRGPRWTWESRGSSTRNGYLAMEGRISLAELTAHMAEVAPHAGPNDLMLNWATVVWQREATAEELEERAEAHRRWQERHEAWERETYARLKAKFEVRAESNDGGRCTGTVNECRVCEGVDCPARDAGKG